MITLVHGADNITSREFLNSEKTPQSLTIDALALEGPILDQLLFGTSLFGENNKIFIENLFNRKAAKNFNAILDFLNKESDLDIYIWAEREISTKSFADFPKYIDKNFKVPQTIWAFLDGIRPNSTSNVSEFHNALSSTEAEIIFSMIVRQFRLMIGLYERSRKNADEVGRLRDWQINKLRSQASLFGLDKLKEIYKKIYKIDKSQKTGSTKLNLVQAIDILLLQI